MDTEGVIIEILARLPATSVIRCSLVCKNWNRVIKSRLLIRLHLDQQRTSKKLLLQHAPLDYTTFEPGSLPRIEGLRGGIDLGVSHLVGTAKGVICHASATTVTIWNPTIQRIVYIVSELELFAIDFLQQLMGLGDRTYTGFNFDVSTHSFKLVKFSLNNRPGEVAILSVDDAHWRTIEGGLEGEYKAIPDSSQLLVNETAYWFAYIDDDGDGNAEPEGTNLTIIAFDFESERLREIQIPVQAAARNLQLSRWKGDFPSILHYTDAHPNYRGCEVWALQAGAWAIVTRFNLNMTDEGLWRSSFWLLEDENEGNILSTTLLGTMEIYNPGANTSVPVPLDPSLHHTLFDANSDTLILHPNHFLHDFQETLVLLDQGFRYVVPAVPNAQV